MTLGCARNDLDSEELAGRLALAPLGFIAADARPGCLCLSSFHTFPGEHTVVKTQSLIERRD